LEQPKELPLFPEGGSIILNALIASSKMLPAMSVYAMNQGVRRQRRIKHLAGTLQAGNRQCVVINHAKLNQH
jgi:hypothetical protein